MRKLFIAALALGAMVACNNGMEEVATTPATGNEVALVSVSLKAAGDMTRAEVGSFEDGSVTENAIKNATFYFFDENGGVYTVAGSGSTATNAVEVAEDQLANWKDDDTTPNNIEAISNIVLVLKAHMDTPPAKMVALINVDAPATFANKTLAELKAMSTALKSGDHFVMSNSVYEDTKVGEVVYATQIQPENIFTTPDPAEGVEPGDAYQAAKTAGVEPVKIYVERVAAKVRVDVKNTLTATTITVPADEENGTSASEYKIYPVTGATDTYVRILGWDVTNTVAKSHLIKKYAEATGFDAYNNPSLFRSHWAATYSTENAPVHGLAFNAITKTVGSEAYYHENTLSETNATGWYNTPAVTTGATEAAQLIVAAQLCNVDGTPKAFGSWYGKTYADVDGLKANMINNAAKKIFVLKDRTEVTKGGETTITSYYDGITADDVTYYQIPATTSYTPDQDSDRRYEVRVKATEGTTYYKYDGSEWTAAEVNATLNSIEPAMIWTSGYTYYYTMIDHYGDSDGIVRNHLYDIKLASFNGFGTPVYDPTHVVVPEKVVEQEPYHLTAEINVLSWALVSQDVELGK